MREVDRTRLLQANRSRVRRRFVCRLKLVLCFFSGVVGFTLLCERNLRIGAARAEPRGLPVSVVESAASRREILKSDRFEDGIWRPTEKTSSAGVDSGRKFHRTLILNESAQRKLLSRAPMEFTKAARQIQIVMTLPMPDGTFARFRVEESPVMAAGLAAHFPDNQNLSRSWS